MVSFTELSNYAGNVLDVLAPVYTFKMKPEKLLG
jgi:hypothetical protein